jgi:predicted nucleotidyltransferase
MNSSRAKIQSMTLADVRSHKGALIAIAERHGATNIRVFGSIARGDNSNSSDLDLLVDLEAGRTLMDLGGLLMDLQEEIGTTVEVATERILRPELRVRVLSEAIPL